MPSLVETIIKKIKILVVKNRFLIFREKLLKSIIQPKVSNEKTERVEIIIKELKSTPIYHTNLISYLAASANMTNYELLESTISLSFNNYLIANMKEEDILEEVKYSIALSIRDTYGINEVIFNIPDTENTKISI